MCIVISVGCVCVKEGEEKASIPVKGVEVYLPATWQGSWVYCFKNPIKPSII